MKAVIVLGGQGGKLMAVIILSTGISPKNASQLPRTTSKLDERSHKGSENDCGVAELLPRCERLILAPRRAMMFVVRSQSNAPTLRCRHVATTRLHITYFA